MDNLKVVISEWIKIPTSGLKNSVFAVGDVHGYSAHFQLLLDTMSQNATSHDDLIFLGDLIDRGPNSLECLDIAEFNDFPGRQTLLWGNHELLALSSIFQKNTQRFDRIRFEYQDIWLRNGGSVVVDEFHTKGIRFKTSLADFIKDGFGDTLNFIKSGRSHIRLGNLLFVHAGLHPRISIKEWFNTSEIFVESEDLHWAWIREPFLLHQGAFEDNVLVIHGHTPDIKIQKLKKDNMKIYTN